MDFAETEDQKMIRVSVKEFVERNVADTVMERDNSKEFPLEIVKQLGELGMLGIYHEEQYGGGGCDGDKITANNRDLPLPCRGQP